MNYNQYVTTFGNDVYKQTVQYAVMVSKRMFNADPESLCQELEIGLNAEDNGALDQFAQHIIKIDHFNSYLPLVPNTTPFVSPSTVSNNSLERDDFNANQYFRKERLELAQQNTIETFISEVSQLLAQTYSAEKARDFKELLEKIKKTEITLENFIGDQTELYEKIIKFDNIVNNIKEHQDGNLFFIVHGEVAIAVVGLLNCLNIERFTYFLNWLHINSDKYTSSLFTTLLNRYVKLREEVGSSMQLNESGHYVCHNLDALERLKQIHTFFMRIRHIQRASIVSQVFSKEAHEEINQILLNITN